MIRRTLLMFALLCGTSGLATAQQPQRLSLEEALQLHAENNLELRLARVAAVTREGEARLAGALPNPVATLTYESLSDATRDAGESYLTLSQEVVWPWVIGARHRAGRLAESSAIARLEADSLRIVFDLQRAYVDAWLLERRLSVTERVAATVGYADSAAAARFAAGDVSGYEFRRIRLEHLRYERILEDSRIRVHAARRRLTTLVVGDLDTGAVAPAELPPVPSGLDVRLQGTWADEHPLIRAAQASEMEARGWASGARGARIPAPTFTGGYKTQRDGLSGAFLGAALALPILNQYGSAVRVAQAAAAEATTRRQLARRSVERDVQLAAERFRLAERQLERVRAAESARLDELLEIARVSYAEGELDLLGLLDAGRAFHELGGGADQALAEYWLALFDLERAAGTRLRNRTNDVENG